jgi:regulatory protein
VEGCQEVKRARRLKGSHPDIKKYALRLLQYRSRSRKEMFERLKRKGFSEKQINDTCKFLEATGLIKDETLAAELFRDAVERRCLGRKGVEALLCQRGIEREIIEETLPLYTKETEEQSAMRFVEKKMKNLRHYPEDVVKRRLWGMLRRRGFSTDIINMAVRSIRH